VTGDLLDPRPGIAAATRGPIVAARRRADPMLERVVMAAYDDHARDLHAFARALVRDPEAAEDLVADAFERLIREARAGRRPDDVRAWLFRVTGNLVLSRGRRVATARRHLARLVDRRHAPSPEEGHLDRAIDARLLDALAALSTASRVAVVMAAHGASGREIAQAIGRSEAATRTLLTRARQRLRERLAPDDGSDR
jgi:RNA polymerase sigma-70 factor, ECF subfamily